MSKVVILGAGPIASELASSLTRNGVEEIVLFDGDVPAVAAGKALDVRQSCPILGSDSSLIGSADPADVLGADVLAVADQGKNGQEWTGEPGLAQIARLLPRITGPVVFAGTSQAWLLERCTFELGRRSTSTLGSSPIALEAAVAAMAALEADTAVSDVRMTIAGRPPKDAAILWDASTIGGEPATARLDSAALRRLEARLPALWPPGAFALASAATRVVLTILRHTDRTLTCYAVAPGHDRAAARPVRFRHGEGHPLVLAGATGARAALGLG
ncbi:MAG: hypothetical protein AB7I50_20230 [Vicinamibacterales bacterium]